MTAFDWFSPPTSKRRPRGHMVKVLVQSDSKGSGHQFGICYANNYIFLVFWIHLGSEMCGWLFVVVCCCCSCCCWFFWYILALGSFQIKETRFYFNVNWYSLFLEFYLAVACELIMAPFRKCFAVQTGGWPSCHIIRNRDMLAVWFIESTINHVS